MNKERKDRGFTVKANGKTYKATLPRLSFGALVIGKDAR
jgi:hypothetical protein